MECRLDVNKIEQGIIDKVKQFIPSGLFRVEGNTITSSTPSVLDSIPQSTVDEALKYKNEVSPEYRDLFTNIPQLFLQEISAKANASEQGLRDTIKIAGAYITDLALKSYPNEGKLTKEEQVVDQINKQFKDDVLIRTSSNTWDIKPSEDLVMQYVARESGGYQILAEYARQQYIKKAGLSVNLINNDLWLNFPKGYTPTIKNLLDFMKKLNPKARVSEFENMSEDTVALIGDYIIMLKNGNILEDLPHEVSHFFIELLPDEHEWKKEMMKDIINLPKYGEVYEKYKNNPLYQKDGRVDIDKIKREAAAQVVGDFIRANYRDEADAEYKNKKNWVERMVDSLMRLLKKLFHLNSPPIYREYLGNAFEKSAQSIIDSDVSQLQLQKVPSPYDGIFFNTLEEVINPTYKTNDHIVKSLLNLANAFRRHTAVLLRRDIEKGNMEALKEELRDKGDEAYMRIIERFEYASKLLSTIQSEVTHEYSLLEGAVRNLAEAYRMMVELPDSIERAVARMKNDGTMDAFLNNMKELSRYMSFMDNIKVMTQQFEDTLSDVQTKYPDQKEGKKLYDIMSQKAGDVSVRFNTVNKIVKDEFSKFWIRTFDNWVDGFMREHLGDLMARLNDTNVPRIRAKLIKEIFGKITSPEQVVRMMSGEFSESIIEIEGVKVDLRKRVNDISFVDQLLFYTTSPSILGDPLITTAVKYYYDNWYLHKVKGEREARVFLNEMSPLMEKIGKGWQASNEEFHTVETMYDASLPEKRRDVRVLMTETHRFNFNRVRKEKQEEIKAAREELVKLLNKPEDTDEYRQKSAEAENKWINLRNAYSDWVQDNSYLPFTQEYYEYEKLWKANSTDSALRRKIKNLKSKIFSLQELQAEGIMLELDVLNADYYINITHRISELQEELEILEMNIPEVDKELYKKMDEIFETDEEATERFVKSYKDRMVESALAIKSQVTSKAREKERENMERRFDDLHTIRRPNDEYWETVQATYDKIAELTLSYDAFKTFKQKIDDLVARQKRIKKYLRDQRGDINLASARFSTTTDTDIPTIAELKKIEADLEDLRRRHRAYSSIVNAGDAETFRVQVELIVGLIYVVENASTVSAATVKNMFSQIFDLSISNANNLIHILQSANFNEPIDDKILNTLGLDTSTATFSVVKAILSKYQTIEGLNRYFEKEMPWLSGSMISDEIRELYAYLDSLSTKNVSYQYAEMMRPFISYANDYINSDISHPVKDIHRGALANFVDSLPSSVYDWETLLNAGEEEMEGGSLFDTVIAYMKSQVEQQEKERRERQLLREQGIITTPEPATEWTINDEIKFYENLHSKKVQWIGDTYAPVYSPIKAVVQIIPTLNEHTKVEYPRFLTIKKIKDQYINEKIKETDPRVLAGTAVPNVDINGRWLPLPKKGGEFWNAKYDELKNDPTRKDTFAALEKLKLLYLKIQEEKLGEGERLDTLLPAKYLDTLEKKLINVKEVIKYINGLIGNKKAVGAEDESRAIMESIGALTQSQIQDIYDGESTREASVEKGHIIRLLDEEAIKMKSKRRIPIGKTSKDAIASILMFIEDVNEFTGKTDMAPILTGITQMLEDSHNAFGYINKNRSEIMRALTSTRIYNKIPKNIFNTPVVSKAISVVLKLAGFRLMGDIIGASVNYISGSTQILQRILSENQYKIFGESVKLAGQWLASYDADYWRADNQSLKTQIIEAFNMIPSDRKISTLVHLRALQTDVESFLRQPRSESEKLLALQTAFSLLLDKSNDIELDGQLFHFYELYQLGKDKQLELKPEFRHLAAEWNPVDGTKVVAARSKVMQIYLLLHGNYYDEMNSYISFISIGKAAESMKKFFVSMATRRAQGRVLDTFLGGPRVGTHFATANLLREATIALMQRNPELLKSYWKQFAGRPAELDALRQSLAEIAFVTLLTILVPVIFGYGGSDDNDELLQMTYLKQLALVVALRVQSEIGTFIPLPVFGLGYMETKRILLEPFGIPKIAVDNIFALGKLIFLNLGDALGFNVPDKMLHFQNRKRYNYWFGGVGAIKDKGDSKFWATVLNTIGYTGYTFEPVPYIMTFTQMQNRLK